MTATVEAALQRLLLIPNQHNTIQQILTSIVIVVDVDGTGTRVIRKGLSRAD